MLGQLPADAPLNRYPSPSHPALKQRLAALRGLPSTDHVHLGVGSDEVIDLVMRVACAPGKDKILICPPTYGMYKVTAQVNDVEVVEVPLITEDGRFELDLAKVRPSFPSEGGNPAATGAARAPPPGPLPRGPLDSTLLLPSTG